MIAASPFGHLTEFVGKIQGLQRSGTGALDHFAQGQTLFCWLVISAGQAVLYVIRDRGFFWQPPYPAAGPSDRTLASAQRPSASS